MTDLHDGQEASAEAEGAPVTTIEPAVDPTTLNADQREAFSLIEEICASSGLDARPVVRNLHSPYMEIELVGEDVALTFGRLGRSFDALQLLANLIISRRVRSDVRVLLDGAGYRARRAEALSLKAIELATEVTQRNEEAEFEPLPAAERRIIHAALADFPGIETYSEGEEPDRHIVIAPRR